MVHDIMIAKCKKYLSASHYDIEYMDLVERLGNEAYNVINAHAQYDFVLTQDSFSMTGIIIENMTFENSKLEMKVVDTGFSQNFIITQTNGTALPSWLSFDPNTGNISGTAPQNLEKIEITIKAINTDGTTRVLNLTIDLKQLKKANQGKENQAEVENRFIGLKEQIALENQNQNGYGEYLTKLFA